MLRAAASPEPAPRASARLLLTPRCGCRHCNRATHIHEARVLTTTPDSTLGQQDADMVVLVLGTDQTVERESHDRTTITLPGVQAQLAQQVRCCGNSTLCSGVHMLTCAPTCRCLHLGSLRLLFS